MSWITDRAPISITCPLIDEVISIIESPVRDMTDEYEEDFSRDFKRAVETLEKIREANATLRKWGNDLYLEKEDLEKEVDYLKGEIENLKLELNQEKDNGIYWEEKYYQLRDSEI